jgi:thioredoxin-dependent peroxiredoxin
MAIILEPGQSALDFTLPRDGGGTINLAACRGGPVILYFYPKDDTSGCTAQACQFRDLFPQFDGAKAAIIAVSKDSVEAHDKFKAKYQLPFILGSDSAQSPEGGVCERYGVWVEKSMYGKKYWGIERATFLLDAMGVIRQIWRKVKVPGHGEEVLAALRAL